MRAAEACDAIGVVGREVLEAQLHMLEACRGKGGDLRLLRDPLRARAKAVVAIGEARPLVRDALAGVVDVHEVEAFGEAVETAFGLAKPDGIVLLAPACASFDMFRDYADRGRRFKEEVRKLRG